MPRIWKRRRPRGRGDGRSGARGDIVPSESGQPVAQRATVPEDIKALRAGSPALAALIGSSPAWIAAIRPLAKVGPRVEDNVAVFGESGTGKEGVARAVAELCGRRLVAVNCAAIPDALLEDELFGHLKGAFTGATTARRGKLEAAHNQVLFLDEIGDMPMAAQAKLLRALQTGTITPLGSNEEREARPRVVCATHRDLRAMVADKTFREDLYYRLVVHRIILPPLRARAGDVLEIAAQFLGGTELDAESAAALLAHDWPGNVRELENVCKRIAAGTSIQASLGAVSATCGQVSAQCPQVADTAAETPQEALVAAIRAIGQRELARRMGWSHGRIGDLVTGRRPRLALADLDSLARAIGLRIRVEPANGD